MTEGSEEGRRAFFKTVGRSLVLGLTGAGVAAMIKSGRVEVCINQLSPCNQCLELKKGCELPKAMDHRRMFSDATPS
ncbi:MAG: hypothetical protein HY293_21545 [Planctomycetes bacterium]|nr:hypothetical protein [Planctomycetota bacterium]